MLNSKKLCFISFILFNYGLLSAASHSTVMLKDGSVINGNIIVQRPGKDLTIEATDADFVINPKDIVSKKERKVKYDNLSREWKRWALENRALNGDAYGRYVVMEDVTTKKYALTGLVNKPDDKTETMYAQRIPTTYNIKWNDVAEIIKNYEGDVKYDLIDEIVMKTGKIYEGKIVSQDPGKDINIETSKGRVHVKAKDVKEIRRHKPKGGGSYFDLVDYTNIIRLKNGTEKEGVITLNHYGITNKDNYITLQLKNGKSENITSSMIAEYATKYQTKTPQDYIPGKIYVNEFKIEKAKMPIQNGKYVCLEKKVFPFPEGINTTFKGSGQKLLGKWNLVALYEIKLDNGKTTWGYSPEKKKENTISPKSIDDKSDMNVITFGYLSPGYYALVNDSDTEHYVFKITK